MDLNFSVGEWADVVVNYILDHFTPALDMIAATIGFVTDSIQNALLAVPPVGGVAVLALLSLWRVGWKFAIFTALALGLIIHMDLWTGTMESLVEAADFVHMIEKRQGIKISAPEEIAFKYGWIDRDTLLESAERYGKSPYGQHLKNVADGKLRY